jgi:hypothetical protein
MNKNGKVNFLVIILVATVGILLFFMYFQGVEKQRPGPIVFGEDDSSPGGLRIELVFEDGSRTFMGEEFYEIFPSTGFSIVRGATAVSCTTDSFCVARCPVGDTVCESNIKCYDSKCSYNAVTAIAWHAQILNEGGAVIDVTLDSATTNPVSTAFNTAYSSLIGTTTTLSSGQSSYFSSGDMPVSSYETGTSTTFTISASGVDNYYGTNLGSQTSSIVLTVYPDPTPGAFTIQLGSLTGL